MSGSGGSTDWGLTMDAVLALRAADAEPGATVRAARALVDGADRATDTDAALAAKLLVTVAASGLDPTDVAGTDLRARVTDDADSDAAIGTFGRSFAVIGLARTGGAPAELVTSLVAQQCPNGGFATSDEPCRSAAQADPDATSMAVQALAAARATAGIATLDAPIARAARHLRAIQLGSGALRGGTGASAPNANSTGLAAQAFTSAARTASVAQRSLLERSAASARRWVTAQATTDGAIAYDDAARGTTPPEDQPAARDQWRRATTQAMFALAPVPLDEVGKGLAVVSTTADVPDRTTTSAAADSTALGTAAWLVIAAIVAGMLVAGIALVAVRRRAASVGSDA